MHAARFEVTQLAPDAGLTLGALDRYLSDMRAWVLASCKTALAASHAQQRIGKLPGALLDALIAAGGRATGEPARFMRYDLRAPHIAITRTLKLSSIATGILVMASAPALWGDIAQLYLKIGSSGKAMADERLLANLLSCDREVVAKELAPGSPLVSTATCRHVGTPRQTAPIVVDQQVILRFAGATKVM